MGISKNNPITIVAILMACYNRVEKTLSCLNNIYSANMPVNTKFDIYLVDDNSSDQTGKIVKDKYPYVNVIYGNGSLYWNRGMRLAWKKARKNRDYDFYIWINDDVQINLNAFEIIFNDYYSLLANGIEAIISGVCYNANSNEITYGGRDAGYNFIVPNGYPQLCRYINGNFTLIPKKIFKTLYYLSQKYIHAAGDHDYGLRAIKKGFKCFISSDKLAVCSRNTTEENMDWKNLDIPIQKRINILFSIKGFNLKDKLFFIQEERGTLITLKNIIYYTLKVLFPSLLK